MLPQPVLASVAHATSSIDANERGTSRVRFLDKSMVRDLTHLTGAHQRYAGSASIDILSFDVVTPGSSVFLQVSDGLNGYPNGFGSKLTLFSPVGARLTSADDGGAAKCSLFSPATNPAAAQRVSSRPSAATMSSAAALSATHSGR